MVRRLARVAVDAVCHGARRYGRLSHLAAILHDARGARYPARADAEHLQAAMAWLCRAQDVTGCGGVAARYSLNQGWLEPYPETTGYIIPTFLEHARRTGDPAYHDRARRMGDWETEVQLPSGAVRGAHRAPVYPIVFNTGQVILGWVALYDETKQDSFLDAAVKAADWLVSVQDEDGSWRKHAYEDITHAYHTRVAWPILEVFRVTGARKYKDAAEAHLRWVLKGATDTGWVEHMTFRADLPIFTHTIAYTLRGLLECAGHAGQELAGRAIDTVRAAAESIRKTYEECFDEEAPHSVSSSLPGAMDERWQRRASYSCLTGNAQLAIVFIKLGRRLTDAGCLDTASRLIDQVKVSQCLTCRNPGIRGAVPGSRPIWGQYMRYCYPNWAAKFLADALMLRESTTP